MSFQDVRTALVLGFADDQIDDEEFTLLYNAYRSRNPPYPYWEYDRFCLDDFDRSQCEAMFRIKKDDIPIVADSLRVPETFKCRQGTVCSGIECLCILLKRLAYPCRYFDMISTFGRTVPEICMIYNAVLDWMYDVHGYHLTSWNQNFLSPASLEEYVKAITQRGSPLTNCFGFIHGTVRQICRPGKMQRVVYNGHKRVHALKFQAIAVPNGLIANLYGPVEGCRHDAGMLKDSGLLNSLQLHAHNAEGQLLCLYGDPAYPLRPHLMAPYRIWDVEVLTEDMKAFNKAMSSLRVSVEWLFGDVSNSFKFIDFKKNLKLRLSAVGKFYVVAALIRNILTCLYGNTTSKYFQIDPPTINSYLDN